MHKSEFTTLQTAITRNSFSGEYHLFRYHELMGYVGLLDCQFGRNKMMSGIFYVIDISLVIGTNTTGSANYLKLNCLHLTPN